MQSLKTKKLQLQFDLRLIYIFTLWLFLLAEVSTEKDSIMIKRFVIFNYKNKYKNIDLVFR